MNKKQYTRPTVIRMNNNSVQDIFSGLFTKSSVKTGSSDIVVPEMELFFGTVERELSLR